MTDLTMQARQRLSLASSVRLEEGADKDARTINVVCSTSMPNDHGFRILQEEGAWDLSRFQANPVVLYGHNDVGLFSSDPRHTLPIGRAENVRMEDGALRCTIRFASADANPLAEQVYRLMSEGMLSAVSVGFDPLEIDEPENAEPIVTKALLYELSVVPMGSDPGALRERNSRALVQLATSRRKPETLNMPQLQTDPNTPVAAKLAAEDAAPAASPPSDPPGDADAKSDPMQECIDACSALQDAIEKCSAACHAVEDMADASDECKSACEALRSSSAQTKDDAEACKQACTDAMGSAAPADGGEEMADDGSPAAEMARKLRAELVRVKGELRAQQLKASSATKSAEIEKLLMHAKRDGKTTPALERELRKVAGVSLAAVKSLVAALPRIHQLTSAKSQPVRKDQTTGPLVFNGKAYAELSFAEKHELATTNPDLFAAMKSAHEATKAERTAG